MDEKLVEPSLDPDEQPERILRVNDEEVKVERYISEEERLKREEKAKEEEQRRLKEMVITQSVGVVCGCGLCVCACVVYVCVPS